MILILLDNTKNKNIEGGLDYSYDNKSIKEKDDEEKIDII